MLVGNVCKVTNLQTDEFFYVDTGLKYIKNVIVEEEMKKRNWLKKDCVIKTVKIDYQDHKLTEVT